MRTFLPLYEKPADYPAGNLADTLARDGYVVGGLQVVNDSEAVGNVVAVKIIFIRYKDGELITGDRYEADWIGNPKDASPVRTLASNGQKVVGICGRQGLNLNALGVVVSGKPTEGDLK